MGIRTEITEAPPNGVCCRCYCREATTSPDLETIQRITKKLFTDGSMDVFCEKNAICLACGSELGDAVRQGLMGLIRVFEECGLECHTIKPQIDRLTTPSSN